SAGKTGGFWQRQGTRRTEADVEDTVRRHVPVTVGTADARGMSGERAATQHTAFAHINTQHVFIIVVAVGPIHRIAFVAFLAPRIPVPVHVEQAQAVRLETADRPRPLVSVPEVPGKARQ